MCQIKVYSNQVYGKCKLTGKKMNAGINHVLNKMIFFI